MMVMKAKPPVVQLLQLRAPLLCKPARSGIPPGGRGTAGEDHDEHGHGDQDDHDQEAWLMVMMMKVNQNSRVLSSNSITITSLPSSS